jgi:hypothetical protein
MTRMLNTLIAATIVLAAGSAHAAADPAVKCKAAKNKIVGGYYACRQKAEATAISKGGAADYTKCTAKFMEKWDGAESASGGSCPDNVGSTAQIETYVASQATESSAIVGGAAIAADPECGDGQINGAGEQCDGVALGDTTCASLGLYGSTSCTLGCELDFSGCTSCPSPGVEYANACWVLGAISGNCNTACTALGMVYDTATRIVAGSDGSNVNCTAVLDALGTSGGPALDNAGGNCPGAGAGCAVIEEVGFRARCGTPVTDATSFIADVQRACACK